jgi:hypothetical protein
VKEEGRQLTTISVSVETKKELDWLRKELGARTYDELLKRVMDSLRSCREVLAREKVLKVLCGEFLETNAALSVWVKLLAKRLDSKEDVAMALDYLIPNPNEDGMYVMNREMCLPATPKRRAVAAPEEGAAVAGSEPVRSEEEVAAASKESGVAEAFDASQLEDYAKNTLVPLLRERVGDRDVWDLREFRKLVESLVSLPPSEVIEMLVNLGFAELRGNQVVLKLDR